MKVVVVLLLVVTASVCSGAMISGLIATTSNLWRMNYTIDTGASFFYATVSCQTSGWIGMGLTYDGLSGHSNADIMVAFSVNGTQHILDAYSNTEKRPQEDTALGGKNDLTMTAFNVGNGSQSVTFMRALDTNDGKLDAVIENKDVFLSWACGNDTPTIRNGTFHYRIHPDNQFDVMQVNLFSPTSSNTSTSSHTPTSSPSITMTKNAAASSASWLAAALALSALF